jgi:hypothetical protein
MKTFDFDENFDVEEVSALINEIMSKWSVQLLDIAGPNWIVYNYEMEVKYIFQFQVDFHDLEVRIKLEDLKLNVIHHIESLKDETTYRDNLVNAIFLN